MTCESALVLNVCTFKDYCCEQGLSVIIVLELVIGHFVCCLVNRYIYIKSRENIIKMHSNAYYQYGSCTETPAFGYFIALFG